MNFSPDKTKNKLVKNCGCDDGYIYYGSGCSMQCSDCKGTGKIKVKHVG